MATEDPTPYDAHNGLRNPTTGAYLGGSQARAVGGAYGNLQRSFQSPIGRAPGSSGMFGGYRWQNPLGGGGNSNMQSKGTVTGSMPSSLNPTQFGGATPMNGPGSQQTQFSGRPTGLGDGGSTRQVMRGLAAISRSSGLSNAFGRMAGGSGSGSLLDGAMNRGNGGSQTRTPVNSGFRTQSGGAAKVGGGSKTGPPPGGAGGRRNL